MVIGLDIFIRSIICSDIFLLNSLSYTSTASSKLSLRLLASILAVPIIDKRHQPQKALYGQRVAAGNRLLHPCQYSDELVNVFIGDFGDNPAFCASIFICAFIGFCLNILPGYKIPVINKDLFYL
jgi:hypothetical protein